MKVLHSWATSSDVFCRSLNDLFSLRSQPHYLFMMCVFFLWRTYFAVSSETLPLCLDQNLRPSPNNNGHPSAWVDVARWEGGYPQLIEFRGTMFSGVALPTRMYIWSPTVGGDGVGGAGFKCVYNPCTVELPDRMTHGPIERHR